MRGEYVLFSHHSRKLLGSPPLARGILNVRCHLHHNVGITPACAGNTGKLMIRFCLIWDHPRLRGEYFIYSLYCFLFLGSPPLARRILYSDGLTRLFDGITPACAGNTELKHYSENRKRDHPRLRGEYSCIFNCNGAGRGSPPLARGIQRRILH